MTTIDGPDFICVGLPKAGTGWLYDQVVRHPDFWMPPVKELRYFGREFPGLRLGQAIAAWRKAGSGPDAKSPPSAGRALDVRDLDFLARAEAIAGRGDDPNAYASLFAPKGDLLTGDVSPIYAALKPEAIRRIADRLDETRVIALLRDPVERAWSHWRMDVGKRRADGAVQDPAAMRAYFSSRQNLARALPTRVVEKWSAAFGGRFRYFFLDDIAARPAETRAEILAFIGADPSKATPVPAGLNRKAAPPVERTPEIADLMRALFSEERRRCADMFGGPALGWVDAAY